MFRAVISLNLYVNLSGVGKYVVTLFFCVYMSYIISYIISYI